MGLQELPCQLKETAKEYFEQGLSIVPVFNKRPLVEWAKWQTIPQTLEEFESLPWAEANGFAVIAGTKTKADLFLGIIDFDIKNVSEEAKEKGKKALKQLLVTRIEQTPSGGQHWIFLSHNKPNTISAFHNEAALELLGESKLCIMSPSQGYLRLNDNSLSTVQDLEDIFLKALYAVGIKSQKQATAIWFDRKDLAKGYKGPHPHCINSLLKGTSEGLRNEHGIRLASYYLNFRQYQPKNVTKILKEWNRLNTPTLTEAELTAILKSAATGNYVYGCTDPVLKDLCSEDCRIKPKTVVLTDAERVKAEQILERSDLLEAVVSVGRKRLIGEDYALIINFCMICSGQTSYPISGIISGFSGAGKNESLRAIKPLIPEEWLFEFTTSTPEAVKYIPEDFSGTLLIYEAGGLQSKTGTLGLRAVGEGESIETIYPMRDEATGKMSLGRAKTNAKNFVTTESDIDVQPDLYRRVLKRSMDHSETLTKRVLVKELRESFLPESLRKTLGLERQQDFTTKEFQNALRVQDWKAEVIVFPPKNLLRLLDLAVTKEQQVALRTQFNKVLSFVKVLALLNQKKRIRVHVDGMKYVIANPEDYRTTLAVLEPSFFETVARIEKRQQEVLDLLENMSPLDKNKVAEKLKISTWTAARALKTLAKNGYLKEDTACKPYSYDKLGEKPKALSIEQNPNDYERFYENELKIFLNNTFAPLQRGIGNKKPNVKIEMPVQEEKTQPTLPCKVAKTSFGTIPSRLDEKNTKSLGLDDMLKEKPLNISLNDLVSVFWSDSFFSQHQCGVCGYMRETSWQAETVKGEKVPICESCVSEYEKRRTDNA